MARKQVLKKNVSEETIENIKPAEKERLISDGVIANLYLVVSPRGKKVWRWQSSRGGKTRKVKLGTFPAMDIHTAREEAHTLNEMAESGKEPVAPAKAKVAAKIDTFAGFAEDMMERKRVDGKGVKTIHQYESLLRGQINPVIGEKRLTDLTREDIDGLIYGIRKKSPVASNRILQLVRMIIRKAVAAGKMEADVTAQIDQYNEDRTRQNDRALSIDEMARLWVAARHMDEHERDALRLVMLTAARKIEAFAARSEDWDGVTWEIPKSTHVIGGKVFPVGRTKNDVVHPLKLAPVGRSIIEARKDREFLFADHVHDYMFRRIVKNANAALKKDGHVFPEWRMHDVRRGVATALESEEMAQHRNGKRFAPFHAEMLLNHTPPKLQRTYSKADRSGWIEELLLEWEELLMAEVAKLEEPIAKAA